MSQLNDILEYLATAQLAMSLPVGLTPIRAAYAYLPADPSSADCPFFVNDVSGGPVEFLAVRGFTRVVDNIDMDLCIARYEADATLALNLENVAGYRDAVLATFAARVRLSNQFSFITEAYIDRWSGLIKLEYGSTAFAAITYRLHIEEQFLLTVSP